MPAREPGRIFVRISNHSQTAIPRISKSRGLRQGDREGQQSTDPAATTRHAFSHNPDGSGGYRFRDEISDERGDPDWGKA